MPSVQFFLSDLESLLGRKVPRDRDGLNKILAYVKGDVESLDEQVGSVNVEVKDSNHPDIWSVEGIARSLRGFLGLSKKPLKVAGRSQLRVIVDEKLLHIRPFIACAIVRSVRPSEESLKSWISLQDKMDQTYGRKRRKASIGLYQADLVKSPLHYTVGEPDKVSFSPLGSNERMTLRKIVDEHPKGQEYGPIIFGFKEWPLLVDGRDQILSLPPVINSNDLGRITTETRDILVEVTGTNLETVHDTLKIVVMALNERGGRIYSCTQSYGYKPSRTTTPDMTTKHRTASLDFTNKVLGTSLTARQAAAYLGKAGYEAKANKKGELSLEVPPYRLDIMHPVDLVEDAAISMGLNNLEPDWPKVWTPGGLSPETEAEDKARELMVGLSYQEVLTYALSSTGSIAGKMRLPIPKLVQVANPKMTTHTVLRDWLLPSLLEFLSGNTHVDYPQRIFEVGPCAKLSYHEEAGVKTSSKLAAVSIHATSGFTEIRSSLDSLLNSLGFDSRVEPGTHASFLEGRFGRVLSKGREIGFVGEIHPQVITAWGLSLPAAGFELDVDVIRG